MYASTDFSVFLTLNDGADSVFNEFKLTAEQTDARSNEQDKE